MISVTDRSTGETHTGRSPESIARTVWGAGAEVRYSKDPNTAWEAHVVRNDRYGTHVLAALHLDEEARAAAEPPAPDDVDGTDALLVEVRAAADALALAEARRLAAMQAAFEGGRRRDAIASAARMTRDGVYKLVRSVTASAR